MTKVVYFDGSPKGYACICSEGNKPVYFERETMIGYLQDLGIDTTLTNNNSEYLALLFALCYVNSYDMHTLVGDSQLVINQMNGDWKVNNPVLQYLHDHAKEYIFHRGLNVSFRWVTRENNLAGSYLDKWLKKIGGR